MEQFWVVVDCLTRKRENQNMGIQKERAIAIGAAFKLPAIFEAVL